MRISAQAVFAWADFRITLAERPRAKGRGQTPQAGTDSGSPGFAGRGLLREAVARLRDGRWVAVVVALAFLAGVIAIAGR
ncbi:sensor histidine kinase, partial [Mesorhizobium sp. M7A.F.Ca.CA.004.09.1.2]